MGVHCRSAAPPRAGVRRGRGSGRGLREGGDISGVRAASSFSPGPSPTVPTPRPPAALGRSSPVPLAAERRMLDSHRSAADASVLHGAPPAGRVAFTSNDTTSGLIQILIERGIILYLSLAIIRRHGSDKLCGSLAILD